MSNSQRVAIITGASQGIGEGLVSAYRKLGYAGEILHVDGGQSAGH